MSVVLETGGPSEKEVRRGVPARVKRRQEGILASLLIKMKTAWVEEESHRAGQS